MRFNRNIAQFAFAYFISAHKKMRPCIFVALCGASSVVFAVTPTIVSIAGTLQTGQTITITGTNMVNEVRTNWDPFFTNNANASGFEGVNPGTDGYSTAGSCASYDTTVKLMGSKSMRLHDEGAHDVNNKGGCYFDYVTQSSRGLGPADAYYRVYSRWNNTSWPDFDIKYWWLGGSANPVFFNLNPNGGAAPTQIGFLSQGIAGGSFQWFNIPGGAIQNNRWYLIEGHVRRNGSGAYVVELWVDNKQLASMSATVGVDPNAGGWGWESNTNYWNTNAGFVSDQWQDGFVVSGTRVGPASLIEISNSPTYSAGTKVYQSPLFISENSVQVKVDLTGLGAGPYYVWVTNSQNERSLSGTLFASPTNLKVN